MPANPTTTNRFGPSGSFTNKNASLERIRDAIAKSITVVFFDTEFI